MVDSGSLNHHDQEENQSGSGQQIDGHLQDALTKEDYFDKLYALNDDSEEEEISTGIRDFIQKCTKSVMTTSEPPLSLPTEERRIPPEFPTKKVPGIHRTRSAPASGTSVVKETPLPRKHSLLRYDISTPPSANTSFESKQPTQNPVFQERPAGAGSERRTVSDPLFLKNSEGIDNMLRKNQKRKRESEIKLVPEKNRIFNKLTFFYMPNNDIAKIRKVRIQKAQTYGAQWAQVYGNHITHMIVDKGITYQSLMDHLKAKYDEDKLPDRLILVNENYPVDCIHFRTLLNPNQKQYELQGMNTTSQSQAPVVGPGRNDGKQEKQREHTPPRDEYSDEEESHPGVASGASGNPNEDRTDSSPPREVPKNLETNDEFDKIIEVAHNTRFLPLDDSDSDTHTTRDNASEDDADSERDRSPIRKPVKRQLRSGSKPTFNQANFACMKAGTDSESGPNPNDATIKAFQELAAFYERTKQSWRNMAYRKGVSALRRQTRRIKSYDEAIQIPGIGDSLATKVVEMYRRGKLEKLEYARLEPRDLILQKFTKIYGVGINIAEKWYDAGHRSLADLVANVKLTENQQIGIDHYDDFNTRIPRAEMDSLASIVKDAASELDPEIEVTVGGSYRRGALTSGDIDFMITKPNTTHTSQLLLFLKELVEHLIEIGFLVAALAVPSGRRDDSGSKWHGACVHPVTAEIPTPIWRRIDLLLVPASEWGAALIYFTGDDIFNRSLRLKASTMSMRLNQRGLYKDVMRGPGRVKVTEGSLVEGRDERKIFEALGVAWRTPEQRIVG
ncbi:hypothetical protein HYALB_00001663 [Hymenoscyphus albidus]|uniref:DNA-directed DNA polymerase n=1 Tax=Hymenoscyphus albidus TaxID=595503 RepID=A0A9N9LFL3_9HELO|nr:hypothetical protein HYALB_00001663 [Hymenoscyphus albidus]